MENATYATAPFVSGEDLDALLNENGGSGEWEGADAATSVERWQFPRFHGAERIGTCEAKGDTHKGVHTEVEKGKGKCKDFTPDPGNMYLSRSGLGPYDTDVETLGAWLDAPRNIVGAILALGEPGTGKTALIEAAATHTDRTVTTVVGTPDHTKDSLFLRFVGEGKGDCIIRGHVDGTECEGGCHLSPFTLGPLPYAAKHGHLLYVDEFMLFPDGLKPVFYALADGRRFLPEGNIDGSALEIHPNFRLVLSSNPLVRGASLPEPLASRCASTTITVETDEALLGDLGIDDSIIQAWVALGTAKLFRPQIRELRVADYWLGIDKTQAASAFLPEHCPESEREAVRNIVVSFLGGRLPEHGRLVVK